MQLLGVAADEIANYKSGFNTVEHSQSQRQFRGCWDSS